MSQWIPQSVRDHPFRLVSAVVLVLVLIVILAIVLVIGGGDGDGQVSPAGDDSVSKETPGGVAISEVWITQDDERKDVVLDNPLARLFEAGSVVLAVSFTGSADDVKIGGQDPTEQDGSYQADVTLEDGIALGNEPNKIIVEWNGGSRELKLWAFAHAGSQSVVPEVVETSAEMMVNLRVDPVFQEAFGRFCSFAPEEVDVVELRFNDRPRFQVAFVNGEFQESRGVIMPGQPIWVLVSKSGEECFINPPCGNPEVDRGKLSLAPPVEEVMIPTPTPPVGPTPSPPATPTPTPPGATPTPPPTTPTPPPTTPTPTSTPPTRTPTPTPTPIPPPPPAFTCPGWHPHGDLLPGDTQTRVGTIQVTRNVSWSWDVTPGYHLSVLLNTTRKLQLQVEAKAHLVVYGTDVYGRKYTACVVDIPYSEQGATPAPTRTPAPVPTPGPLEPTPRWTPPSP